ncbi:hypothetical protein EJ04DRAFT_513406 [Polyplosphaeria fusca]|uniref:Uncharacterized protein n=1 Tax=Polyplosphaeria fusca TaxID=682080 RepID=A0A9P4UYH3_9PLEO|nr:hypothetical protein EJ04DRAFT_513406 [Polyplosphaeria fusca]
MRNVLIVLFALFAIALATPNFAAFVEPILGESPAQNNETLGDDGSLELVKRQSGCDTGYSACTNLNNPGLCCRTNQVCSADGAGHIACCPLNNACTGTINPVGGGASATPTSSGAVGLTSTTTTSDPFGTATSTATGTSFIQVTGSAPHSMVPNSYYPFAAIPTTYLSAAACSSAYTSCSEEAVSCTAALANGRQGVTVSAPNGGATVTAIVSLGSASASSICESLSSLGCSGLNVQACTVYGNGGGSGAGRNLCGDWYGMGAGVAVGLAGQLLR